MTETPNNFATDRPLEDLFLEHAAGLSGAVRSILGLDADVQEVLQAAFLKAWKAETRGRRGVDPVAWMFVVTMNTARDLLRARRRRQHALPTQEVEPVELEALSDAATGPHGKLEYGEWLGAAREAIRHLRPVEKEVFLLRVSAERTFGSIAATLGIPEGTAKTRMRTALRELQKSLAHFAPAVSTHRQEDAR